MHTITHSCNTNSGLSHYIQSIYTNIIHSNHILKPQRFDSLTRQAAANNQEGRCMLLEKPVLLRLL